MNTPFHGTSTAGVVAATNPRVKLVLVQIALESAEQAGAGIGCLAQDSIDAATALLADPDVRAAYLQRPLAGVDRELADARTQLGVQLVNESFGHLARFAIEDLLYRNLCPEVSLASYFQTLGDLDQAYAAAHVEPGVLVVQSAGNDGARVDGPQDSLDCRPDDPLHLLVGAYGFGGAHSSFTNFGDCVEVYAPGEAVVSPLPGDWLYPLSGTSFSAPLVVGLLSGRAPSPFAPASARATLDDLREPNRNIRPRNFPAELLYDVNHDPYVSALLAATASAPVRPPDRFSAAALNRALWPIRWVRDRAHRGAR
jgi:subtilisin family serine protease